jgi:hypothetical protein
MKNMVKLFGITALTAVIVFSMAACEPEPEGYLKLKPADTTITIKNTMTSPSRRDITGVRVYAQISSGKYNYLIATETTYDTSYTVATNGTPVTLPKVTVPAISRQDEDDNYSLWVFVSLPNGQEAGGNFTGKNLPSAITFDLYYDGLYSQVALKKE